MHRRGRVLLLKRKNPPNLGRWALPGGLVELGETVQAAVAREVLEETGLAVEVERLLDVQTDLHRDEESRIEYHYVLVDYSARPLRGRVKLNSESSKWGWFNAVQTKNLDMSAGTRQVLGRYFKRSPR